MRRLPATRVGQTTSAAYTRPAPHVRVPIGELMPPDAVGFAGVGSSWAYATLPVLDLRDRLQVRWVHATPDAAQVIEFHATYERPHGQLIGNTVRRTHMSIQKEDSIAVLIQASLPLPAAVRSPCSIDLLPEPLSNGASCSLATLSRVVGIGRQKRAPMSAPPLVVLRTPSPRYSHPGALIHRAISSHSSNIPPVMTKECRSAADTTPRRSKEGKERLQCRRGQ